MTRTARTVHRPGVRGLKRHLHRAIRRRTRRTLRALSKHRDARSTARTERHLERRRALAAGTPPVRSLGGSAKPAPNLIGAPPRPTPAKKTAAPKPGAKKTAKPRPGAGKACKRCDGTGVIHLRRGGKYAGAKPCPHVVNQWKQARANTASPKPGPRP